MEQIWKEDMLSFEQAQMFFHSRYVDQLNQEKISLAQQEKHPLQMQEMPVPVNRTGTKPPATQGSATQGSATQGSAAQESEICQAAAPLHNQAAAPLHSQPKAAPQCIIVTDLQQIIQQQLQQQGLQSLHQAATAAADSQHQPPQLINLPDLQAAINQQLQEEADMPAIEEDSDSEEEEVAPKEVFPQVFKPTHNLPCSIRALLLFFLINSS